MLVAGVFVSIIITISSDSNLYFHICDCVAYIGKIT